jgi:purine-binding chemotaxis protein CheW
MEPSTATPAAIGPEAGPAAPREVLAFKLGAEEYGIDILRVKEIRSYEPPTRIAHAPEHIKGVINLRGVIVPIVDLRLKFRLQQAAYDAFTVTIVLHVGHRIVGLVVDAVSDVVALGAAQLQPVPALDAGVGGEHLMAIGTLDDRLLLLLDIDKLLSGADLCQSAPTLQ